MACDYSGLESLTKCTATMTIDFIRCTGNRLVIEAALQIRGGGAFQWSMAAGLYRAPPPAFHLFARPAPLVRSFPVLMAALHHDVVSGLLLDVYSITRCCRVYSLSEP